jgi:hypothetical protein
MSKGREREKKREKSFGGKNVFKIFIRKFEIFQKWES